MDMILDAHVSRSNTSGSVPPVLLLNLLTWHTVPAQSVAHVKVYVPTLKLPTARRCVHLTRVQWPGAARTAVHCYRPKRHERCEERARRTRSGRRRRRCKQQPLRCTHGGLRESGGVERRACNTSQPREKCNVRRCIELRTAYTVLRTAARRVATCNTACCDLQRAVLQPATRQPANSTDPGYHLQQSELQPATRCVARRAATCNTLPCNLLHPVLQCAA